MCNICGDWQSRTSRIMETGPTEPASNPSPDKPDAAVAHNPQPYVLRNDLWANHRGRTLTWSNATRFFSTQRQHDLQYRLDSRQVGLIRRAFAVWEAVANVHFREVFDSTSTNIRIGWSRFSGSNTRAIAYMRAWGRGNQRTHAVIAFDTNDNNSRQLGDNNYFLWVAVHEIGHALGLGHSRVTNAIMYYQENQARSLHQDDIAGIQRLYGPRGGGRPTPNPNPNPPTSSNLGDLTNATAFRSLYGTVNRSGDPNDFFRFTLIRTRTIRIELVNLSRDADLYLLSAFGIQIAKSERSSTREDVVERSLGPGAYYIRVDAYASGSISYRLRYRAVGVSVAGTSRATAWYVGNLTNATGYRSDNGTVNRLSNDTDYRRFTLSATRTIRIELRGLFADANLYLEGANGYVLASSSRSGTADDIIERRIHAGTYYIRVDAHASGTIRYQLRYRTLSTSASGSTRQSAWYLGNLTNAYGLRTRQGTVNPRTNDTDYHRFTLSATRTVNVELSGLSGDADLYLDNASGQVVGSSVNFGTRADVVQRQLTAGTYYIRVDAYSSGTIRYQLRYRTVRAAASGSTRATAWYLGNLTNASGFRTLRGTVNRVTNDDEYRRFTLSATRTMRLELRGLSADADLYLENALGQAIASSVNSGTSDDAIERTLSAGTYYIRVDAYSSGTIRYQLRYRTVRAAASGSTRATAWYLGNLTNASGFRTFHGTVNRVTNDDDYRRFTLSATRTMRLELRGLSADADLYLENALGQAIASSVNSGTSDDAIERTLTAGTYFIRVDAYSSGTIRYLLRYRRESVHGRTRGTAFVLGDLTNVTGFRSRSGTVNRTSNDDDYHRFTLSRTRGMSIVLDNLSADADLYVESAGGRTIYRSALAGNRSDVIYPTLRAGTYYIRVDAFDGGTIRYRLSYTTFEQTEVGDLTYRSGLRSYQGTVNTANDEFDGFRFRLTRARTISLQLTNLSANANLRLIDSSGKQIAGSGRTGTSGDSITRSLGAGTYLVTVDAVDRGTIRYRLFFGTAPTIGSAASRQATDTAGTQPPPWREETVPAALSFQPDDRKPLGSPGGMLTA